VKSQILSELMNLISKHQPTENTMHSHIATKYQHPVHICAQDMHLFYYSLHGKWLKLAIHMGIFRGGPRTPPIEEIFAPV